jgi:Zn-dependent peptidase ImmA (M78 family)
MSNGGDGDFAHQIGDFSHQTAKKVYELSELCLMAHSIRAVQMLLEQNGVPKYWVNIKLSASWKYIGKRAMAVIMPNEADILVDGSISLEDQRKGIAHELAHVLCAKLASRTISSPHGYAYKAKAIEDACKIFEEELCARHHKFYTTDQNKPKLLFPSLIDHPLSK